MRIELTTYPLPRDCATTTLLRQPWYPALYRAEPLIRNCWPVRPPGRFGVRCYNVRIPRRKAGYSDFHAHASPWVFKGFRWPNRRRKSWPKRCGPISSAANRPRLPGIRNRRPSQPPNPAKSPQKPDNSPAFPSLSLGFGPGYNPFSPKGLTLEKTPWTVSVSAADVR